MALRGRPGAPGLAPTSLRRRTASIRGFYRFAYGDGLIGSDVAAHLDLPRQSRLLPETLTVDETIRLIEAAVQRSEAAAGEGTEHRAMQELDVKMQRVEGARAPAHFFQQQHHRRQGITRDRRKPQRLARSRHELGRRADAGCAESKWYMAHERQFGDWGPRRGTRSEAVAGLRDRRSPGR
jgi:hypothetical protein